MKVVRPLRRALDSFERSGSGVTEKPPVEAKAMKLVTSLLIVGMICETLP